MIVNQPDDISNITTSVLADLISRTFRNAGEGLSTRLKLIYDQVFEDFAPLMQSTYLRLSRFRIICKRDEDVSFEDIYISTHYKSGDTTVLDRELVELISDGANVAVLGIGGAGKTLFMRYCWLTLFKHFSKKIPIYYELRNVNGLSTVDLKTVIKLELSTRKPVSDDLFDELCCMGRFIFLLDGFDEIKREARAAVESQIHSLCSKYPKCNFVVSSRSDLRFSGWQGFRVFETQPLTIRQTKSLLKNIPFETSAKTAFLKRIDDDFYKANKSFLSTPLLAIIMLMTFRDNTETPNKMSIFYQQAFVTLFQMHDATKMYSRPKCLDINDFQDVLSLFCLLSYTSEKYYFTDDEALTYIRKSIDATAKNVRPEDFLSDLIESVNILKRDGFDISFIHRSFQEYFCALALTKSYPGKLLAFSKSIGGRLFDSVISLCLEMNRHLFVTEVIQHRIRELDEIFEALDLQCRFPLLSTLDVTYEFQVSTQVKADDVYLSSQGHMATKINHDFDFLIFLSRITDNGRNSTSFALVDAVQDTAITGLFPEFTPGDQKYSHTTKLTFSFDIDHVNLEIGEELTPTKATDRVATLLEGMRPRLDETFDRIEAQVRRVIKSTRDAAHKELKLAKSQADFLDDIFTRGGK